MNLDGILSYLYSILPPGMKKYIKTVQQAPTRLLNVPESSPAGSRKDTSVQTDQDQVKLLQAALKDKEREVKKLMKEGEKATQRAHSFQAELEAANQQLEKAETDRNALDRWAQWAKKQLSEAERRAKDSDANIAQLSRELHRSQAELQKTAALLDTRSAELRDAQAYLGGLDDVADAEVLQLVDGLNSRIFQVAAKIADAFQQRYSEQKDAQVSEESGARLLGLLGDGLLLALSSIHHADDPLVVQTALQAAMVSYTRWLCVTWDFRVGDAPSPCVLQDVYQSIRRSEQQSIAGRWRALSRTYVKTFLKGDADRQSIANGALLDYITDILLASGIATPRRDLRVEVERSYVDAIREVVHLSHEFQCITGERIISRDLSVVITIPGKPFDSSCMIDEWADPKSARRQADLHPVLCTTQLGLVREERKANEGMGGEVGIAKVVLLKPKVALTSLLEELWSEQVRSPHK